MNQRKRRFAALSAVSLGGMGFAIAAALSSGPACTSAADDSDGGTSASVDGAYADAPTFCDFFTEAGAPCPAVSATACFPMCATGGCYCRASSTGPRWTCTVDFSCVPDAGPLEDSGPAGTDDATVGSVDASDASDAAVADGGLDAGAVPDANLPSDDAGDASLDASDAAD
jgi:hypothetical protein